MHAHTCMTVHIPIYTYIHVTRAGQNRTYSLYMTVYLVISLPKIPCIHRIYIYIYIYIYMVLANSSRKAIYVPAMLSNVERSPARGMFTCARVCGMFTCARGMFTCAGTGTGARRGCLCCLPCLQFVRVSSKQPNHALGSKQLDHALSSNQLNHALGSKQFDHALGSKQEKKNYA